LSLPDRLVLGVGVAESSGPKGIGWAWLQLKMLLETFSEVDLLQVVLSGFLSLLI
jgi:hypothetical protein